MIIFLDCVARNRKHSRVMWPGMASLTLTLSARIRTNSRHIGTGKVLGGGGPGSYGSDKYALYLYA